MNRTQGQRLASGQVLVVLLLFAGYASYYFCRSDLSVGMPLIAHDLQNSGLTHSAATIRLGSIVSFGVLAYAIGKFALAGLGDVWGGRGNFIIGLAGAIVFTLIFSRSSSIVAFFIAWIGNRFVQSMGWAGLVKICSGWFSYQSYGTVIGILSISYLVGDAVARQWMGTLISQQKSWRSLFYLAAAVSGIVLVANLFFLKESRVTAGFSEPEQNPLNVFHGETQARTTAASRVVSLVRNRGFLLVCLLSLGTTIIRETFNTWTPTYLHFLGYTEGSAAGLSATFPWVGALSVLLAGLAGDRLGPRGRTMILAGGLSLASFGLLFLISLRSGTGGHLPVILIALVAFGLLGPYSFLAGALALDFGGKQAGATSSGLIDGVGYLGGVLAGDSVARISVSAGWGAVFAGLAAVSVLSTAAAGCLLVYQRKLK